MSQELVQTGFFDVEPVSNSHENIAIVTGWGALSKDQLRQEATVYHNNLERQIHQLTEIIQFAESQRKNFIYEKGELYRFMKESMTYEEWITWLKEINVSRSTASECIQWSIEYKDELTSDTVGSKLSRNQIFAIHRSGEGRQILAKLNSGEIKPTQEVINAELEAAKQRAKNAEETSKQLQEEFDLFKDQAKKDLEIEKENNKKLLEARQKELEVYQEKDRLQKEDFERTKGKFEEDMRLLKEEKDRIEQSKMQTVQEDTPETKAKLEEAKKKIKDIEEREKQIKAERDKKADDLKKSGDRVKKLTEQVKGYLAVSKQETHNEQVRTKARQCCDAYHQGINQGSARQVRPLDAQQAFGSDEWAMYDETEAALRRAADDFARLKEAIARQFVDATPIVEAPIAFIEAAQQEGLET